MKYGTEVSGRGPDVLERGRIVFWLKDDAGNIKCVSPNKLEGDNHLELVKTLRMVANEIEKIGNIKTPPVFNDSQELLIPNNSLLKLEKVVEEQK